MSRPGAILTRSRSSAKGWGMDDTPTNPYTLVTVLYVFAALFALGAGVMWFRFVDARKDRAGKGGAPSFRWLTEAATMTGLTLFAAAGGFLLSLFL